MSAIYELTAEDRAGLVAGAIDIVADADGDLGDVEGGDKERMVEALVATVAKLQSDNAAMVRHLDALEDPEVADNEVAHLRARVGVLERDNDDLFEKWKSASAFYFVANCGNCDEDVYNGPCISTLEHNGRMVIPFDMGSGEASFSCGRCGADNYTGDVEMFTEGGRDDIDDDDDPDSDGEVSS